ncbi:MAG TPA: mechanosensitive ion channel domain-containing protein [Terriglobales bacterium]|nr:mechanosensitive ion channel domain-containing protein [Terriglobales bacterium]
MEQIAAVRAFFEANLYMRILLIAVIYGLVTAVAVRVTNALFRRLIARSAKKATQFTFMHHAAVTLIIALGAFNMAYQVEALRSLLVSLLATSSVIAVAVAFASQEAVANIVSGIFLTIFAPFTIGDRIRLPEKNITGFVEDINLRHTVIRTLEHSRVILPNSVMNSAVLENYSLKGGPVCASLEIGISYESSIDKASAIIAQEVARHPKYVDVRTKEALAAGAPAVTPVVTALGDFAVTLTVGVWAENPGAVYAACGDLRKSIKERFEREGVVIPYPHTVVKIEKEE